MRLRPSSALRSLPPSPLWRVRLILLVFAQLGLLGTLAPIVAAHGVAGPVRLAGIAGTFVLAASWYAGFRRGGAGLAAEAAEAIALAAVLYASPVDPVVPLFAALFRAAYGSPARMVVRAVMYSGILCGVHLLHGATGVGGEMGKILGITVGSMISSALSLALHSYETSEQRLRSVVANSTDVLAIVRSDLTIQWQAATVRTLLGYGPEALTGRSFLDIVHGDDAGAFARFLGELAPGESGTTTVRLRLAGGEERVVAATAANRVDDPYIAGVLINLRDETDRRRLERERRALEMLSERLEAQRQRTELEARLQRAQRLETVGQLAGGIAHDFNNLLAVIQNYAGFIREELDPQSELQPDVAEIEQAAERGARLTRQLLLFSQRRATAPEVLSLNDVISGMDGLLKRSAGAAAELVEQLDDELADVEIDAVSVEQVLMNLVVNARDAVGDAGGTVTVATATVDCDAVWAVQRDVSPGRYVRLTVSDDGTGMDEATLAGALQPFFTTKPAGQGTGLGLATVDGIASRAGGCVAIDSEPGRGTSVHVYLPVSDKPRVGVVVELPQGARYAGGAETIVVAEDEAPVRALVERILTKAGYHVTTVASGSDALELLDRSTAAPDLLLTDMVMPGMTGWELAQHQRARRPGQRVLFMSGYSELLLRDQGPAPGEVVSKPFSAEVLLAAVREALEAPLADGQPLEGEGAGERRAA